MRRNPWPMRSVHHMRRLRVRAVRRPLVQFPRVVVGSGHAYDLRYDKPRPVRVK